MKYTAAVEALKAGDRLRVTLPNPERANDPGEFYLERGGPVTAATFRRLVPNLHPQADGLFADGPSQTYTWKDAT
ncbi:hypothetical protein ACVDG3_08805 [Meridianimarinicoccus sp. RP-17]|uniref:hypothetical protein n=1 Tax=Meridianimarinicoccus zhengii TaxID=2056810 RepID=UPI0013A699C6|nr:hypothetical protein [Phycocomes zhengii]